MSRGSIGSALPRITTDPRILCEAGPPPGRGPPLGCPCGGPCRDAGAGGGSDPCPVRSSYICNDASLGGGPHPTMALGSTLIFGETGTSDSLSLVWRAWVDPLVALPVDWVVRGSSVDRCRGSLGNWEAEMDEACVYREASASTPTQSIRTCRTSCLGPTKMDDIR